MASRSPRSLVKDSSSTPKGTRAYVDDLKGADKLFAIVNGTKETIPTRGELQNPSWSQDGKLAWAEDLQRVAVWSPQDGSVTKFAGPQGSVSVFAPVFPTNRSVDAVVQEPTPGIDNEEDGLNNIYRHGLRGQGWQKLTSFHVSGDEWSVIRTPVHARDSIYFVRLHGHANATGAPAFQLWRLHGHDVERLRDLPFETYLAGYRRGHLLYSAHTNACHGDWGLFAGHGARLTRIGCGKSLADPLTGVDPDLASGRSSKGGGSGGNAAGPSTKGMVVVIGDFPTSAAAERQAETLPHGYYGTVLNHAAAPEAVKPGAWIVAVPPAHGGTAPATLRSIKGSIESGAKGYLTIVKGIPGD